MRLLASFVVLRLHWPAPPNCRTSACSPKTPGAWPEILGFHRAAAPARRRVADFRGAHRSLGERRMARPRGARRHPDSGRRIVAGRPVRLPACAEGPGASAEPHRCAPSRRCRSFGRRGSSCPCSRFPESAQVFARERWTGAPMTAGLKRGAGAVLWVAAPPGERGHERFPYLLNALADLGLDAALPQQPPLGLLRFRLPHAGGRGLLRGALAQGRNRRPARRRLAQFRARSGRRRVPEEADRGLPSRRHPGLRLVRTAARQREVLGRSSRSGASRPPCCRTRSWIGAS